MIFEAKGICSLPQQLLVQFVYDMALRINEAVDLNYKDVYDKHVVLYTRKSRNSARSPRFLEQKVKSVKKSWPELAWIEEENGKYLG